MTERRSGRKRKRNRPARRHGHARALGLRHGRSAQAIVRQRHRDRRDAMPRQEFRGARPANEPGRAVVVARDREVGRFDLPQRRLAREQLDARLLGGEARGEARRAARSVAGVVELLRGKELAQILGRRLGEQALDPGDLDGVDAAAAGRRRGRPPSRWAPGSRYAARTTRAALVPAKPRQRISATLLRGFCAAADTGTPAQAGSSRARFATPGTVPRASAVERERRFQNSGRGDRVPDRPLERGRRRRRGAEDAADRRGFRNVRLRRAVAVRDDHPDVRGRESRAVERLASPRARGRRRRHGSR